MRQGGPEARQDGVTAVSGDPSSRLYAHVTDLLFLLITVGFFGLTVAFVRAIEWIVGPDVIDLSPPTGPITKDRDDHAEVSA